MTYIPRKIAVTGGAGFIGSNFIHFMLNQYSDIQIYNIDKLTYAGSLQNVASISRDKRYVFFQIDICSQTEIETILRNNKIDTIVHFAAESHVDRSIANPGEFIQTNVVGTYSLLQAARKVWLEEKNVAEYRFHHISTDEVYGSLEKADPAFTEQTPYAPKSPYSASKAGSDHLVQAYYNTYKLPITMSNCSNNYGPYQHLEKLIPTIISNCFKHQSIPIYNDGSNIRDWLFVEDHCRAIDLIIRKGQVAENYNVGGNTEYNNLDLTKLVCELIAHETRKPAVEYLNLIHFVKDRPGHDFRYAVNCEKIKKELGWQPAYTLRNGLVKTIQWYYYAYMNVLTQEA